MRVQLVQTQQIICLSLYMLRDSQELIRAGGYPDAEVLEEGVSGELVVSKN